MGCLPTKSKQIRKSENNSLVNDDNLTDLTDDFRSPILPIKQRINDKNEENEILIIPDKVVDANVISNQTKEKEIIEKITRQTNIVRIAKENSVDRIVEIDVVDKKTKEKEVIEKNIQQFQPIPSRIFVKEVDIFEIHKETKEEKTIQNEIPEITKIQPKSINKNCNRDKNVLTNATTKSNRITTKPKNQFLVNIEKEIPLNPPFYLYLKNIPQGIPIKFAREIIFDHCQLMNLEIINVRYNVSSYRAAFKNRSDLIAAVIKNNLFINDTKLTISTFNPEKRHRSRRRIN